MIVNAGSPRHHIDVVVFASPLVRVGRWRCPADHPQFLDSGPSSDALFAFPREGVWIEHEGRDPFVADRQHGHLLQQGPVLSPPQAERPRRSVRVVCGGGGGDRRDAGGARARGDRSAALAVSRSPTGRAMPTATCGSEWCFTTCRSEANPDRLFVEEAVLSILGDVTRLAYLHDGSAGETAGSPALRRRCGGSRARCHRAAVHGESVALGHCAATSSRRCFTSRGSSRRARAFRCTPIATNCACARRSSDCAIPRVDLIDIALDLGFSSHSHFTETFRRSFAKTPSAVRDSLSLLARSAVVAAGGFQVPCPTRTASAAASACGHTMFSVSPS